MENISNFSISGDRLYRYIYEGDCIVGKLTVIRKEEFISCYEAWIAPKLNSKEVDEDEERL